DYCFKLLVDLHQRRRESFGEAGCFASPRFVQFHREAARRLLAGGRLRMAWLEVDGPPGAAEDQVLGDGGGYAYQSGNDPDALACEPGRLITITTLRKAIDEGRHAFDFLRGDEIYKAHWRAEPRPTQDVTVMANTPSERLRHNLWVVGQNVKEIVK